MLISTFFIPLSFGFLFVSFVINVRSKSSCAERCTDEHNSTNLKRSLAHKERKAKKKKEHQRLSSDDEFVDYEQLASQERKIKESSLIRALCGVRFRSFLVTLVSLPFLAFLVSECRLKKNRSGSMFISWKTMKPDGTMKMTMMILLIRCDQLLVSFAFFR